MFEKQLEADLRAIFGVDKITYDMPASTNEQECIFINPEEAIPKIKTDGSARFRVRGEGTIFGPNNKLKFGFISTSIANAPPEITSRFHFSDFEGNAKQFGNIVQRSFSFVYFFSGQYDPDQGSITSIKIELTEG